MGQKSPIGASAGLLFLFEGVRKFEALPQKNDNQSSSLFVLGSGLLHRKAISVVHAIRCVSVCVCVDLKRKKRPFFFVHPDGQCVGVTWKEAPSRPWKDRKTLDTVIAGTVHYLRTRDHQTSHTSGNRRLRQEEGSLQTSKDQETLKGKSFSPFSNSL